MKLLVLLCCVSLACTFAPYSRQIDPTPAMEFCNSLQCDYNTTPKPIFWQSINDSAIIKPNKTEDELFNDYDWLPEYKPQYGNSCSVYNVEGSRLLCYNLVAHDLSSFVRLEIMATEPLVYIMHRVLENHEVDQLVNEAINITHDLEVQDFQSPGGTASILHSSRVAKGTWLFHGFSNKVKNWYGLITGFDMHYSEAMHVIFYEPGGHYAPHYDYLLQENDPIGNRLGTILTFLGEPEEGGSTTFPVLGFSVYPTKGSAIVWFNMDTNRNKELNSLHGGCPVWKGKKHISTVWIREKGNEMSIKCNKQSNLHYRLQDFTSGLVRRSVYN